MSPEPPSLFTSAAREDHGPAPYTRGAYELLDRGHRPISAEVRRLLDQWYQRLPAYAAPQIRQRFVSGRDSEHLGAFFELYLYELAHRLGAIVDIDVGRDELDRRRPDLLIECEDRDVYIEATVVTGDDVHDPTTQHHLDGIYDAVNAVTAPAFFVEVEVEAYGSSTPSRRKITPSVQRWLDALDPDALLDARDADAPSHELSTGGWEISLTARAVSREHRSYPHHRVVGTRSDGIGEIDDIRPLRRKLKRKAGHYGELGKPFLVAVLCAGTFVEDRDIDQALFGPMGYRYDRELGEIVGAHQPDGAFIGPKGAINSRLSGVLTWVNLSPTTMGVVEPTLWTNPWAAHPVSARGPWRCIDVQPNGRVVEHPATRTSAGVLGLPDRWPYVESAERASK